MSVDHCSLDVVDVSVVLQSSLEESRLLTQLGDVRLVVVGEHLVAHDGVGDLQDKVSGQDFRTRLEADLGGSEEVHLQQTSLEVTFSRFVVLESVKEEGRALLDHVHLHEHIHHLRGRGGEGEEEEEEEEEEVEVEEGEGWREKERGGSIFRASQGERGK